MPFINSMRGTYSSNGRFAKKSGVLGRSSSNPASSADAIYAEDSTSPNGLYWITLGNGQGVQQVYCLFNVGSRSWMVIHSTPLGSTNNDYRFSTNRQNISGNPFSGTYSLDYARRSGVNAISSNNQSLIYQNNSQWMRISGKVWNLSNHNSGNFRYEFNTDLITADGTTDTSITVGLTNYSIGAGGDFGIGTNSNGLDHHSTDNYWNLNSSCVNHYLYNYGTGYKVNTALMGWQTTTIGCEQSDINQVGFLVAMR